MLTRSSDYILNRSNDYILTRSNDYILTRSNDYILTRSNDYILTRSNDYILNRSNDYILTRSNDYILTRSNDCILTRSNDYILDYTTDGVTVIPLKMYAADMPYRCSDSPMNSINTAILHVQNICSLLVNVQQQDSSAIPVEAWCGSRFCVVVALWTISPK